MPSLPTVSVIIPTYNRHASLRRALDSLQGQTFPMDRLEVIVVDDGSTDDTRNVARQQFPFAFHCASQKNQGATAARNHGAELGQAEFLVFMDDDVVIAPPTLAALVEMCGRGMKVLAMGTIVKRNNANGSVYAAIALTLADSYLPVRDGVEFPFIDCNSELLACRRADFFALGMFQDPTAGQGWPNWDDVDFGYRAYRKGFRLLGAAKANAEHWDDSTADRFRACRRFYGAGRSAAWLFKRHPELRTLIPMLLDKTPPAWGQDSPRLVARKLARQLLSTQPAIGGMHYLVGVLERRWPAPAVLRRLYYWLHGAHLLQGYRAGLRQIERRVAEA